MKRFLLGFIAVAAFMDPENASAQWATQLEAGVFSSTRTSTDTSIDDNPFFGGYLGGYASTTFGNDFSFAVDGRFELISDKGLDDVDVSGPVHSGVLGVHLGREFGTAYAGAFGGVGWFDGYDSDFPMNGWYAGIEAENAFTGTFTGYAQVAYIEAIGDPGDNEFIGYYASVGGTVELSDRLDLGFGVETAYSPECFEDCSGDWGQLIGMNVTATYALNDTYAISGGVRHQSFIANTEDTGTDTSLFLGVVMTPGGNKPMSTLRSPIGGFVAAGWMDPLD